MDVANPPVEEDEEDLEPRFEFSPAKLAGFGFFLVASLIALYFLLPQLAGLEDTWHRIEDGSPGWLALAALFTVGSFLGYVALFLGVFIRADSRHRIGWRESYQITMAGLAATRLLAAGGAGGLLLTAWALRRAGMERRVVADKTLSFLILTYLVYMFALIGGGIGLRTGLFEGPNTFSLTVVPAVIATLLVAVGLAIALVPTDFERRLEGFAQRQGRLGRAAQRAAHVPASVSAGMRDALHHIRTGDPALLGAIAFWAFQIAVLWAAFRAFGEAPPPAVLVMAFYLGMLGNLLPLPGGIGGVDGGMIGAFAAFGVDAGLAVVAVLVYRGFVFWLPTIPGAIAYFQLRKTIDRWRAQPVL